MQHFFPADVADFVRQSLATGEYANEEDLVVDAVRWLRDVRLRREALRQDIQAAIAELNAEQGQPWEVESLKRELRSETAMGNLQ